jgi:hypothetical protein
MTCKSQKRIKLRRVIFSSLNIKKITVNNKKKKNTLQKKTTYVDQKKKKIKNYTLGKLTNLNVKYIKT